MQRTSDLTPPTQVPSTDPDTFFSNPPDHTPEPESTGPRLYQPAAEGLDVDDSTSEDQIGDGRGQKRRREDRDPSQETHNAPEFKVRRTVAGDGIGEPTPNSSASSADSSQRPDRATSHAWMRSPRNKLRHDQLKQCVDGGKCDLERPLTLLFGPKETRPAEQFFLAIGPTLVWSQAEDAERFKQLVSSCGALRLYDEDCEIFRELFLYTSGFEKQRFTEELLEIYRSEAVVCSRDSVGFVEHSKASTACGTALQLIGALGDRTAIRELISEGADFNFSDASARTLLMSAAEEGDEELVQLLIEVPGIDLNHEFGQLGLNALKLAAEHGHYRICVALLDAGAKSSQGIKRFGALYAAAGRGDADICKLILKSGLRPDPPFGDGFDDEVNIATPLMKAASAGSLACCQVLLEAGADLMRRDEWGRSVLSYAAKSGSKEMFEFLLQKEPRLLGASDALHAAARLNHIPTINHLLEHDVDVNYQIPFVCSRALHEACRRNAVDAALRLIEAGADPSLEDRHGNAFMAAVSGSSMPLVELLLPHMQIHKCRWLLEKPMRRGDQAIVELLLAAGLYSRAKEAGEEENLSSASLVFRHAPAGPMRNKIVGLFLENGLSLDETDANGNDLLMLAAKYSDAALVALLVEEKARVGHTNTRGENALDLALLKLDAALDPEHPTLNQREIVGNRLACVWTLLDSCHVPAIDSPLITRTYNLPLKEWTRELLFAGYLRLKEPAFPRGPGWHWNPLRERVMAIADRGNEGIQRHELNHDLIFPALPSAGVELLKSCFDALPALKSALAGTAMLQSRPELANSILAGMLANIEKIIMEDDSCRTPYSMLPESLELPGSASTQPTTIPLREALRAEAQQVLSAYMEYGVEAERKNTAAVIENLFDTCIMNTWPSFQPQVFRPEVAPRPGSISNELQLAGIYAVLAEAIDAAWSAAWSAVSADAERAQVANLTGRDRGPAAEEIVITPDDMTPLWRKLAADFALVPGNPFDGAIDTSNSTADFVMEAQRRERLQRAFRIELATRLDSPNAGILTLPGQPPEVAGIYADLVHRQLHMLTQFIDRPSLADKAPVPDNDSM